jgi:uncharacterized protein YhaN
MRLASFHIDGFGALADFGVDEIGAGLVVVLGPNEAGKSTLFDFLTGVLFGFPTRKDNSRFRSPVRGGRHGGRVGFVDDAGGRWVVERYAGAQRGLSVRLPDGSDGDERSLSRALAGASASLFEAVFAVGLNDLGQMKNLESDEVRELLFTASIFGQRRSATKAMRHLGEARDELARPRREDAMANRLAAALEGVRAELAVARQEAGRYEALQREASRLDQELETMRVQLKDLTDRGRELQLLESCWRHYRLAQAARAAVAALPPVGQTAGVIARAAAVRELAAERSGHFERVEKLEELLKSRAALESSLERRLARMGPNWTRERAVEASAPELLAEGARAARDRLTTRRVALASAEAVLAQAESLLAAVPSEDELNDVVPERIELEKRQSIVSELRDRLAEAERLQLEVLADERASTASLSAPLSAHDPARPALVTLLVAGLVVCAVALALFAGHHAGPAAVIALVGLLLLAACGLLSAVGRRGRSATARARTADDTASLTVAWRAATARQALLERSLVDVAKLSQQLGLPLPPSRVDIDRCAAVLQRQLERRRQTDDRLAERTRAESRRAAAAGDVGMAFRALATEQAAYESWCAAHGFAPTAQPDSTLEAIAELAEIREQVEALGRIEGALRELEASVTSFSLRCRRLFSSLDLAALGVASPQSGAGLAAADIEATLAQLVHLLEEATALEANRSALERDRASAEGALESALGDGKSAERMRSRLATGDVLLWVSERDELASATEELRTREEEAVRRHQSLAEDMGRLAASDHIADLERRRESLEVTLDDALHRYLVLGTARALLQRTLAQHERERQPAVVARAAAHFERVTGGRYVGLLADSGIDGRQSLRVLSATGEMIDAQSLSRGTLEQLYLCLRLGLADSFAERSVSLPIVLDDVLVNFDPVRARAVATELAECATTHQIVVLTCHPHLAEMMLRASDPLPQPAQLIQLGRPGEPRKVEQLALAALTALPDLPAHAGEPTPAHAATDPDLPTAAGV